MGPDWMGLFAPAAEPAQPRWHGHSHAGSFVTYENLRDHDAGNAFRCSRHYYP